MILDIIILALALCAVILFTLAWRSRRMMPKIDEPDHVIQWFPRISVINYIFGLLILVFRGSQGLEQKGLPTLTRVFLLFVPNRNREHIIGDLEEEYRTSSKRFPRLWYWGQVIALVANYWWAALRRLAGPDVIRKLIRK